MKLFFSADLIPYIKWLRASTSFVLFKFTTVNTLISACTLPRLWKTKTTLQCHRQQHCIHFRQIQKRMATVGSYACNMHAISLAMKSLFQGEGGGTNPPEIHSCNIVYLQNTRFIKIRLYLQKKGQLLELSKHTKN